MVGVPAARPRQPHSTSTTTTTTTAAVPARRHELDWLRSLVVLGLIPIHAAVLFSSTSDVQFKNLDTSLSVAQVISVASAFGMPLLFLIAGAGSWFALAKRTPGRYAGERLARLLVPFAFATLVIIPIPLYVLVVARPALLAWANLPVVGPGSLDSFLTFYPAYLAGYWYFLTHYSVRLVIVFWAHLWFLPRLLVSSLLLLPVMQAVRTVRGRRTISRLADLCDRPAGLLLLGLPLVAADVVLRPGWLNRLTAQWPIYDQWDQFVLFALFFLIGYVLYADHRFLRLVASQGPLALVLGLVLWLFAQIIPPPLYRAPHSGAELTALLFLPLRTLGTWLLVVGVLSIGLRWFQRTNRVGRYLNDAAFPLYVLHAPVILLLGVPIVAWQTSITIKLLAIVLGSTLTLVLLYQVLIRHTPPLRLLFGLRAQLPRERASDAAPPSEDADTAPTALPPRPVDEVGAGLSAQEAAARLQRDGPNELPDEQRTAVAHFLSLLWGPLPWMIEAAALAALLLRAWGSFWIIVANLGLTAVVAYWQEWRAARAIATLKAQLAPRARVLRDGAWAELPARALVVDDIISVHLGDIVPADAALLEANRGAIALDRSSLTGESLPVECGPGDVLHAGTVVRRGSCTARVVATGPRIRFATTIQLVQKVVPVGHLQRIILRVGRDLIILALVLDLLLVAVSLARHAPLAAALEYALLLAVAAIPVSMPTVLSVAMAAGAQRLARHGVLVARLAAIEEMAALDRLCLDKTGTLTQSTLTAGAPFALPPTTPEQVLLDAALASEARPEDPVDQAIQRALEERSAQRALGEYQVLALDPFDSATKRAEARVRSAAGNSFAVTKGATQVILALAAGQTMPAERAIFDRTVQELAQRGYRTLAVARADQPDQWRVEGLIPLSDPLQPDARQAVEEVRAQGVEIKLLTGDQQAIGMEIARQVGITGHLMPAGELSGGAGMRTASGLAALVEGVAGFTQVLPEDKYHIVTALQQAGHIVGMTGDGVNDTPALRKADVGIAVAGATEAARAASDLIVTQPGLSALALGIGESRNVFERLRTYVTYRLTETIRRLLSLTMAVIAFAVYPLSPAMLALLATFNAVVLVALAYDNVRPSPRPTAWRMDEVLAVAGALGAASLVEFFGLLFLSAGVFRLPLPQVQTLLYLSLSAAGYFTLVVTRTRGPFWSVRPGILLLLAIAFALGLGVLTALFGWFMAPVSVPLAAFVLGYSVLWLLVSDTLKRATYAIVAWRSHRRPPAAACPLSRVAPPRAGGERAGAAR